MLTDSKNNYISSVYADTSGAAMCFADISTGEMQLLYIDGSEWLNQLQNELFGVAPAECVLGGEAARNEKLISFLKTRLNCRCETALNRLFEPLTARERLENHFGSDFESPIELQSISAAGGLLGYLYETQKTDLKHIQRLARYSRGEYLELDVTARRNLELTRTIRSGDKRGSLLWVLDKTKTAMGQRFLRAQLERPLMNLAEIRRRQEAVGELVKNAVLRGELRFQFAL